jgi:hypothetical protein
VAGCRRIRVRADLRNYGKVRRMDERVREVEGRRK